MATRSVALDQMKDFVKCLGPAVQTAFEVWIGAKLNGGKDIDENHFVEFMMQHGLRASSGEGSNDAPPLDLTKAAKS